MATSKHHGHVPRLIDSVSKREGCENTCGMTHICGTPWPGPCIDRAATPVLGTKAPALRGGFHRGTTKQGG